MSFVVNNSRGIRLPPLPTIRELVKLYKLQAIKQLSQNFIMDERLTDKIVRSAGKIEPEDYVLEVGPGPGGITRSIVRRQPSRVILVEKDRRFLPTLELLKECVEPLGTKVDIIKGDILKFSMVEAIPDEELSSFRRLHLIGNLPFAISTRLLINWFEDLSLRREAFRKDDTTMTLTFQKEVADRICAQLGDEQRCRLSVMSQIWTIPLMKFIIPGKAFVPKPDVDVGVVKLIPFKEPKTTLPFKTVEKVVRHLFSMRQKYSRRGFSTLFPEQHREDIADELMKKAGVDPQLRPFEISNEQCIKLTEVYIDFLNKNPIFGEYEYRGPRLEYDPEKFNNSVVNF